MIKKTQKLISDAMIDTNDTTVIIYFVRDFAVRSHGDSHVGGREEMILRSTTFSDHELAGHH